MLPAATPAESCHTSSRNDFPGDITVQNPKVNWGGGVGGPKAFPLISVSKLKQPYIIYMYIALFLPPPPPKSLVVATGLVGGNWPVLCLLDVLQRGKPKLVR
jgi:hypothetical protein